MNKMSLRKVASGIAASLLVSLGTYSAPQTGQRAGEVSRVIPSTSIARGNQKITASTKSVVDWDDLLSTEVNGRARVALDDGSLLNVGSGSTMKVVKHDAGAQQTELELTYGKMRTQAQKISKPGGKFEVRTPAGVAGVVGTDFFVGYENETMNVVVFDGVVRVCNLAGVCIEVKAGQTTSVRNANNSAPLAPVQAPLDQLISASKDTDVGGSVGLGAVQNVHHLTKGTGLALGVLAAVPAVVVPVVIVKSNGKQNTTVCPPNVANCGPKTTGQ